MRRKHSFLKGALCGALVTLLIAGAGALALYFTYGGSGKDNVIVSREKKEESAEEIKIGLMRALIDGYYIGDIDEDALTDGIYKGYIGGLGDPYAAYYNKEETEKQQESATGEYSGIGAVMSQDKDTGIIYILQVYDNSPAKESGMRENDILYKVEGEEVTGGDLTDVVSRIRGNDGSSVNLTLLRGEESEEIELTVTRRTVEAQTVEYEMRENGIGYIRISEFDTVTTSQYEVALNSLEAEGMKGLIVDLRNNPGGNLSAVCQVLDLMLPEGTVVYTEDRNGQRKDYNSDGEHQFKKPLAVLMNGGSASASEIFAGAVQDYGLGKVVGTKSYGKGVVQQVFDLKDGTSVKLTIAEYFTPNGRSVNEEGITPDEVIEYKENPDNPEADNQIDKAAEILGKQEEQQ